MNKLLLIPKRPYPPYEDGATLIYYYMMKYFPKIHVIYLSGENEQQNRLKEQTFKDYMYRHKVQYLKYTEPTKINKLSILNGYSYHMNSYFSKKNAYKIVEYIQENNIDIIICNYQMLRYAEFIKKATKCKIILHAIDAISMAESRQISKSGVVTKIKKYVNSKLYYYIEKKYVKFDKIVVVSDVDAQYLCKTHNIPRSKIKVISNGVDTDYFCSVELKKSQKVNIGFSGIMNYYPNEQAVLYFLKNILPKLKDQKEKIKYWIIGKNPTTKIKQESIKFSEIVEITGFVNDIRPYINTLDIFVSTLQSGGGIKNKILEAMAMGVPVIASSVSVEGINHEDTILVYESDEELISYINKLIKDENYRRHLSKKSRMIVEKKFSWKVQIKEYENLLYKME